MRTKSMIVSLVLLLAVALSACGQAAIAPSAQEVQRTLNVTGAGLVYLTPDIAYINVGVHTEKSTASEAVAESNAQTAKVIDALTKSGVDPKDIRTTNFSIWPSQQYGPDGTVTGTVYMVDNTVYVTVRKLDKLGDLLDTVVKAGANNINSIQFDVDDKTDALSQARQAAVTDARKQADELTKATNVGLGEVQTISYYDSTAPITVQYAKADMMTAGASVPVQAGSMQISTTVTIVYGLK